MRTGEGERTLAGGTAYVSSDQRKGNFRAYLHPRRRVTPRVSGMSSTPPMSCSVVSPARLPRCCAWGTNRPSPRTSLLGDFVIIINAEKVALTGAKAEQKKAYRHSGYLGRSQSRSYVEMLDQFPPRRREGHPRGCSPRRPSVASRMTRSSGLPRRRAPHAAQQPKALRDHPGGAVMSGRDQRLRGRHRRRRQRISSYSTETDEGVAAEPVRRRRPSARWRDRSPQAGRGPRPHRAGHRRGRSTAAPWRTTSPTRCTSRSSASRSGARLDGTTTSSCASTVVAHFRPRAGAPSVSASPARSTGSTRS